MDRRLLSHPSHEAHVAFGFPALLRLEPATKSRTSHDLSFFFFQSAGFSGSPKCRTLIMCGMMWGKAGGLEGWVGYGWWWGVGMMHGYAPPGYLLLPFLRRPRRFLFLLATHIVTAIGGLRDAHSQLFEWSGGGEREREGEEERGKKDHERTEISPR